MCSDGQQTLLLSMIAAELCTNWRWGLHSIQTTYHIIYVCNYYTIALGPLDGPKLKARFEL